MNELTKLQEALGLLIFFPILYKPELIDKDYEEYQTSQVRQCARRLMTMRKLENEAGYPPDKIFVTDWQKTQRERLVVQFAIDKIMDRYLPAGYTQEYFVPIAQQIFDWFLGDAIMSCLRLNNRFDMKAIKKFFYSEIAEDWVERTDNPIMNRKVKFTVQEALTKQGAYKPVDYEQNELAKKHYDEVVQQVIDCLLDMARKEGKQPPTPQYAIDKELTSPTAEVGKPKEAWQMTYKEVERDFYDSLFEQFKRIVTDYFGWGNKEAQTKKDKKREYILANYKFLKFLPNNFDDDDLMRFTYEILQDKEIDRQLRDKIQEFRNFEIRAASTYGRDKSWHKEQIKKAMVNGKTIPSNVLSEYPELQNEALPKFKEGDLVVAPNWREPEQVYKVMSVKYTHKGTYAYTLWAEGIPIQNADESQLDFANGLGAIPDDIGFTIEKSYHAKKGIDIWLIKFDRLKDYADFKELEKLMKPIAYYSNFVKAFVAESEVSEADVRTVLGAKGNTSSSPTTKPPMDRKLITSFDNERVRKDILIKEINAGKMLVASKRQPNQWDDWDYVSWEYLKWYEPSQSIINNVKKANDGYKYYDSSLTATKVNGHNVVTLGSDYYFIYKDEIEIRKNLQELIKTRLLKNEQYRQLHEADGNNPNYTWSDLAIAHGKTLELAYENNFALYNEFYFSDEAQNKLTFRVIANLYIYESVGTFENMRQDILNAENDLPTTQIPFEEALKKVREQAHQRFMAQQAYQKSASVNPFVKPTTPNWLKLSKITKQLKSLVLTLSGTKQKQIGNVPLPPLPKPNEKIDILIN